ncbi:hypothetical protein LguiB_007564 [Lonicera macranthoides]
MLHVYKEKTEISLEYILFTIFLLDSVIGEVVMGNFFQNFCSVLEPMLRKVVNEEVENGLRCRKLRSITRSPSLRIQALEPQPPSTLKLIFTKPLSLPIFTGTKIVDPENNPLQIIIVDTSGDQMVPASITSSIKVEIVVLDGDFPRGDGDKWSSEEFEKNIVRERTGKRPLLTGELNVTVRDGFGPVGDIEFTDNSSWIRSRKFRLGARVVGQGSSGQIVKIGEAMTEAFVVKDHRGELYKKHHPPSLQDEVWRLEKIGKDGAFHKKLSSRGIYTVQDFLKLSTVDPSELRKTLGVGMSEKMWEVTLKHARTCTMGTKLYASHGPNHTVIMNPICQVIKAVINGQTYTNRDLTTLNRAYIEGWIKEAYLNWNSLEEIDGLVNEPALLTQGNHIVDQTIVRSFQQHAFLTGGSMEGASVRNGDECNDEQWVVNSAGSVWSPIGVRYNLSESSSDGDFQQVRSFNLDD